MALIARVIGLSCVAGGLGAGLGFVLFERYGDSSLAAFVLGCVGGIVGALAGTAREVVAALRQKPPN